MVFAVALTMVFGGVRSASGGSAAEKGVPARPSALVSDYAGLFTAAQRHTLEDSLLSYERQSSTQIVVLTVSTLDGLTPAEYATEVINRWGVGQKGKDNGVVLLLKPRNQEGGGEVFIATGYGAEGALPDILCGRIIDFRMMPYLQRGDYWGAVEHGVAGIKEALLGEFNPQRVEPLGARDYASGIFGLLVIIFVVIGVIRNAGKGDDSQGSGGGSSGRSSGGRVFFPPIIGGFGGGFGGSSGGGGFGGFGGGMSGGGGGGRSF